MNRHLHISRFGLAIVAALLVGTGCTVRYITETAWQPTTDSQALYLSYWEGSCVQQGGVRYCSTGDSKVKRCTVNPNNTLSCGNEADAEKLLNP